MKQVDISQAKDPVLRAATAALERAVLLARKTAMNTGTDLVFVKDGRLVFVQVKEHKPESENASAK